jgi:hypothetical protein
MATADSIPGFGLERAGVSVDALVDGAGVPLPGGSS